MATTATTKGRKPQPGDADVSLIQWDLAAGETGDAVEYESFADRSVQVVGTFDGAQVVIEGSLNGVDFTSLSDPQGNVLSFSSGKIEAVLEATKAIRPRVMGGGASTELSIYLFVRR